MTQPLAAPAPQPPPRRRRKLLSRHADMATRYRVFEIPGGLEVDEMSFVEVQRRRVFFDEVVLVTHHRFRQPLTIAVLALVGALPLVIAAIAADQGEPVLAAVFAGIGLLFLVPAALYAAVPLHAVTVYGRRARARIVVRFSTRRARDLFARLSREIAAVQRAEAARLATQRQAQRPPGEEPPAPEPITP